MKSKINIGPISEATMITCDLVPCFLDELKALAPTRHREFMKGEKELRLALRSDDPEHPYWGSEGAKEAEQAAFEALNDLCPPYVHFGASDGEGACYGFWPSIEAAEENCHCGNGEVIKSNDIDGKSILKAIEEYYDTRQKINYVLHVNERGNMTLYRVVSQKWRVVSADRYLELKENNEAVAKSYKSISSTSKTVSGYHHCEFDLEEIWSVV